MKIDDLLTEGLASPLGRLMESEKTFTEAAAKAASRKGTIKLWLVYLGSYLVQYDTRQSRKRFYSHYALAHYLGALENIRKDTLAIEKSDSEEDLQKLVASMKRRFIWNGSRFDLPPLNKLLKQINKFIETGKVPKMTVAKKPAQKKVAESFISEGKDWTTGRRADYVFRSELQDALLDAGGDYHNPFTKAGLRAWKGLLDAKMWARLKTAVAEIEAARVGESVLGESRNMKSDYKKIEKKAREYGIEVDMDISRGTLAVMPDYETTWRMFLKFMTWLSQNYDYEELESLPAQGASFGGELLAFESLNEVDLLKMLQNAQANTEDRGMILAKVARRQAVAFFMNELKKLPSTASDFKRRGWVQKDRGATWKVGDKAEWSLTRDPIKAAGAKGVKGSKKGIPVKFVMRGKYVEGGRVWTDAWFEYLDSPMTSVIKRAEVDSGWKVSDAAYDYLKRHHGKALKEDVLDEIEAARVGESVLGEGKITKEKPRSGSGAETYDIELADGRYFSLMDQSENPHSSASRPWNLRHEGTRPGAKKSFPRMKNKSFKSKKDAIKHLESLDESIDWWAPSLTEGKGSDASEKVLEDGAAALRAGRGDRSVTMLGKHSAAVWSAVYRLQLSGHIEILVNKKVVKMKKVGRDYDPPIGPEISYRITKKGLSYLDGMNEAAPSPSDVRVDVEKAITGWSVVATTGRRTMEVTGPIFNTASTAKREAGKIRSALLGGMSLEQVTKGYAKYNRTPDELESVQESTGIKSLVESVMGEAVRESTLKKLHAKAVDAAKGWDWGDTTIQQAELAVEKLAMAVDEYAGSNHKDWQRRLDDLWVQIGMR